MCNRKDDWGCGMSAVVYQFGEGVEKNTELAKKYRDQSCLFDSGYGACKMANELFENESNQGEGVE